MTNEQTESYELANRILDRINGDPDDNLAVLSRQLLRHKERLKRILRELEAQSQHHEHALAEKDLVIAGLKEIIQACNKENLSDAVLRAIVERNHQARELERLRGQVSDLDKICKYHQRIEADMLKHHDDIFKEAVNFAEWVQDAYPFGESRRNAATSFLMSQDVKDWRLRQSEGYKAYFATPAATALQQAKGDDSKDNCVVCKTIAAMKGQQAKEEMS